MSIDEAAFPFLRLGVYAAAIALLMLVSLGRESVAAEGVPDPDLEVIIQKHESHIAKLISAKVNW